MTDFERAVLFLVKKIKRGKITTYKIIAEKLGRPEASRAVGRALNKNPFPIRIPCHRVIKSDGTLGGYKGGLRKKAVLLGREGIPVKNNKIVNFRKFLISKG